ncbi:MAG TPA: HAMP domain-containing sensor histidine kinase, partial [Usitatibacter sp.]|nr:HAMP domain-containing sensor histidine kinase [Usitatibacter sp.]
AVLLSGLGIFLTLRISKAVETESARYHTYLAQQIVEAFEQDLMAHLRGSVQLAETAARNGAPPGVVLSALAAGSDEFANPLLVPIEELDGYSILMVESTPLLHAPGPTARQGQYFVGLLLKGIDNQVIGAGGYWIEARRFLTEHLNDVVRERLPSNPRMYGGYEATRQLSVQIFAPDGDEIGRVRVPHDLRTSRVEAFQGPFEGFSVRVSATANSPVTWTGRFVAIEIAFIAMMAALLIAATLFGLRYTVRQLDLAQIKSGFVSNVTHELKTPIALIRLAVETLELKRVSNPEEEERFIRTIGRETLRLSQLVDNILDFARLEAGQRVFRLEPLDFREVALEAVESFRPRFDHQGFKVEVDIPESLPQVKGDAVALSHCVLNLLDNAVKYSKVRREVRVAGRARGDEVALSVTDRGIGIAPNERARVFEKFVRLETGLVHDVKGAGLGLSLVDQIIRAHNGRVEVESTVGEGSTFTLVLPAAGAPEAVGSETRRKTGS